MISSSWSCVVAEWRGDGFASWRRRHDFPQPGHRLPYAYSLDELDDHVTPLCTAKTIESDTVSLGLDRVFDRVLWCLLYNVIIYSLRNLNVGQ